MANPGVEYVFSKTPIHREDTFTLDIRAKDIYDMAAWQFDIAFDPAILEAINVTEGDFLKMGSTTLFQSGTIDNVNGKITGLSAIRLSTRGVSGTGTLLQVTFKAKSGGETRLALQNFEFGAITGDAIPAGPHQISYHCGGTTCHRGCESRWEGEHSGPDSHRTAVGKKGSRQFTGRSQRRWCRQYSRPYPRGARYRQHHSVRCARQLKQTV